MQFFLKNFPCLVGLAFVFCSCSTRWTYETSMEVNLPLKKTWEVANDPNLMFQLSDEIEGIDCDEEIKAGTIINVKFKNIAKPFSLLITEAIPFKKCNSEMKLSLATVESFSDFEEITPYKTRVDLKVVVKSILVSFMNTSSLTEEYDLYFFKIKALLDELADTELQKIDCSETH